MDDGRTLEVASLCHFMVINRQVSSIRPSNFVVRPSYGSIFAFLNLVDWVEGRPMRLNGLNPIHQKIEYVGQALVIRRRL